MTVDDGNPRPKRQRKENAVRERDSLNLRPPSLCGEQESGFSHFLHTSAH